MTEDVVRGEESEEKPELFLFPKTEDVVRGEESEEKSELFYFP